jgi:hypothetical protein
MSYLLHNCLRLCPFVFYVCNPPVVKCRDNSVDNLLLLARFGKVGVTLFIEASENLFQSVDCIILDVMANLLQHCSMLAGKGDESERTYVEV